MLDQLEITLKSQTGSTHTVWIDVADNSLSRKWLTALNDIIAKQYHINDLIFQTQDDIYPLFALLNRTFPPISA